MRRSVLTLLDTRLASTAFSCQMVMRVGAGGQVDCIQAGSTVFCFSFFRLVLWFSYLLVLESSGPLAPVLPS